jgi:AmmeMemoRadiSam system protein A
MTDDIFVKLAREAIDLYIKSGEVLKTPDPLPEAFSDKRGVFVSIKKRGELRGCIGTFQPSRDNLALEIIHNAISAATQDPRFQPVSVDELSDISVSVDVLSEPEKISSLDELDPEKYGIIVESNDGRRGLLLPDLEGVDTVQQQIGITRRKAGILPEEEVNIYRFKVVRHK